jgi:hypothetical protein
MLTGAPAGAISANSWHFGRVIGELSQILYWYWDPADVSWDFPLTRGEYDAYIGEVVRVLDSPPEVIAEVLGRIEKVQMGGPLTSPEHRLGVGVMVSRWWRADRDLD